MKAPQGLRAIRAFTLIEMLVVIAIIMFLATVLVVAAMKAIPNAKEKKTVAMLDNIAQALNDYYHEFQSFPPSSTVLGSEWWRHLTLSGAAYQRPRRFDGTYRQESFIQEGMLNIPPSGFTRLPRDAFNINIVYVYPVDNDVANITASAAPSLPSAVLTMTAAQSYYYCALVSAGKDKLIGGGAAAPTNGRLTNLGTYEGSALNTDNKFKVVPGQ